MNPLRDPNPFEVLHLDPGASNDEVVAQAGRLRQTATGEEEIRSIRQAVQALTGSAEQRFLHELLAHPWPRYAWPALQPFRAAFGRPPRLRDGGPAENLEQITRLLRAFLEGDPKPAGGPLAEADAGAGDAGINALDADSQWRRLADLQ